jgi:AmmeMemoRadiSam system protein B/AmmeMemoRadiSam system protein A
MNANIAAAVPTTRAPAVAGRFYPLPAAELRAQVRHLLGQAAAGAQSTVAPKALIAPHAGYVYSGAVAASAYARLLPLAGRIRRVLLLGPVHRVAVRGLALPGAARFATPLGEIEVDAEAVAALRELPQVTESREAHAPEHSLEVHLPFLQEALGEFKLVPLAVGEASPAEVAQVLERLWGGPETLIVVSSDLSHYLPYATAQRIDRDTVDAMLALNTEIDHLQACGAAPVNGLLLAAQRRQLTPRLLDLRNSGDTAGDKSRVVGYASIALYEGAVPAVTDERAHLGRTLLALARASIAQALGLPHDLPPPLLSLTEPGASFVTLKRDGQLRGCIGSLQAHRPLGLDVRANAQAAAFADPRFAKLGREEFEQIEVEVSLLSEPQPMQFADEADLLAQLRPGIDGLIFEYGGKRGTFLPQVWEQLSEPAQFLAQLKRKAGWPPDFWAPGINVQRYTVDKWSELELPR